MYVRVRERGGGCGGWERGMKGERGREARGMEETKEGRKEGERVSTS